MAAGAPIQEVGSQTLGRAQCRMQSKEARDAQFPDKTPILIQKEKLYTNRSVNVATGQEFRKGEKSSVKGTTKEVLP